jgi:hypothetical protein
MSIRRRLPSALALLAAAALAAPLAAAVTKTVTQEPPPKPLTPHLYMVHAEHVLPGKIAPYETATKSFVQLLQEHRAALPAFAFQCLQGEDLTYVYVAPMRSFADEDMVLAGFDKIAHSAPQAWGDVWKRSGETMASADEDVLMEIPDGTYAPANPHLKPEEERYYEIDTYKVAPGMEAEARDIAAQWRALFEKHGLPYGYRVFQLVSGHDMPLVVVVIPARDPADRAESEAATQKELGAERQAMIDKTFAITRGVESKRYWLRPDLSLLPPRPPAH